MPASTRSQTTLEQKGVSSSKPPPAQPKTSQQKRKANASDTSSTKKQKKQPSKHNAAEFKSTSKNGKDDCADDESVVVNRAPVLELWAACVTQLKHPSLPWTTCLSVGSAISTIGAISKGRSIGKIEKPDPGQQQEKSENRKTEQADLDEVNVMSFHLKLKDGSAMVGDQPKKANEDALKKKFGEDEYRKVKEAFDRELQQWKDKEDELSNRAFGMYEDFRPNIPAGQKGWGKKGQLSLDTIRSALQAA